MIIEGSLEVKLPTIWTDEKQRWEEAAKRKEERRSKKKKSQKKEDPGARKGRKVAKHVFPMICGSGGSKSRLAKAAGAERAGQMRDEKLHAVVARRCAKHISKSKCTKHTRSGPLLEVEMSKKRTPLWREAHLPVKKVKTPHVRSIFRSWDDEKVHVVVAGSTFPSQNAQRTPCSDHFWKLRWWKSARRCGVKHISKSKCEKYHMLAPLLGLEALFCVASGRDCAPCQKWVKPWGFCSISKNDGRRVTFEEDLERCIFSGRHSTRDMFIRAVTRSGRWLHFGASDLQVCWDAFAWQVQHFAWPGITFSWQAQYFRQVEWKKRKTHWYEAVSSALNFPFLKDVSQNCFVFDVVNFENWGSFAEFLRFWRCQVQNLRKSRRIALFLTLPSSNLEEVSQNSIVSSLQIAARQTNR